MAINTNNQSGNAINVSFNSILGQMFLGSDAAIVNAEIGKAGPGQSFSGNTGFSADARKAIQKAGGTLVNSVSGILRGANLRIIESAGKSYPYLSVRLQDGDETIFVSLNLSTSGAQILARKLANAQPGVQTELSVFSTLQKREGADRAYAETNAMLNQNGVKIEGATAASTFVPLVNAAIEKLKAAEVDDAAVLRAKRSSVAVNWHAEFLESTVGPKFAAAKPAAGEAPVDEPDLSTAVGAELDGSEDIPF